MRGLENTANVATPHMEVDGALRAVPYRNIDNAAPAGSIHASARDMAQWIRFQIDSGRIGTQRLLPASQLAETWRSVAVIQDPYFRRLFAPLDAGVRAWLVQLPASRPAGHPPRRQHRRHEALVSFIRSSASASWRSPT